MQSATLHNKPLSEKMQGIYIDLFDTVKRITPRASSTGKLFSASLVKPFTTSHLVDFVQSKLSSRARKSMGDISHQAKIKSEWGPVVWKFLHWMSALYTPAQAADFYKLLGLVAHTLPCKDCSKHFFKIMKHKNAQVAKAGVTNTNQFANYVLLLHAMVNKDVSRQAGLTYTRIPVNVQSRASIRQFLKRRNYCSYSSRRLSSNTSQTINLNNPAARASPRKRTQSAPTTGCGCGG